MKRVIQSSWEYLRRLHSEDSVWNESWSLRQREEEKKSLPEITTFEKKHTDEYMVFWGEAVTF